MSSDHCIDLNCCGHVTLKMRGPNYFRTCDDCGLRQHEKQWLTKAEAGVEARSVQSTHRGIRPAQRARILDRATRRCEICGASNVILNVGHFLSVDEGEKAGLSVDEINSDENLFCTCEECNFGQGQKPVSIRILVAIIRARLS
tara:strand:+ start:129 stop:560 length:432 start_codon:yes stop_codon:yes gene_type:complete